MILGIHCYYSIIIIPCSYPLKEINKQIFMYITNYRYLLHTSHKLQLTPQEVLIHTANGNDSSNEGITNIDFPQKMQHITKLKISFPL